MRRSRAIGLLALMAMLAGCAESTMIRSYPVGAKVSVDGNFVGATPAKFVTSRTEFEHREFVAVAEQPGYQTTQYTLQKTTCNGRIVGGVFTLGILLIFKRPTCFESPQYIDMPPLPPTPVAAAAPPPPGERLEQLEKMRDEGKVTPQEYERYRKQILDSM